MQPPYSAESEYEQYNQRPYYRSQTSCCFPNGTAGNGFFDTFSKIWPCYCLTVGTIVFLAIVGLLLDEIGKDA